jgi:shikimate dehydrogenase
VCGSYLEYNNPTISGKTAIYGLVGDPVNHSLSPAIQNAAFHSAGIDAVYVPFPVKQQNLRSAIQGLRALEVKGFNVMAPHKVQVLRYLDKVEAFADAVGSVNTVTRENEKLFGYNTDGPGAIKALEEAGTSPDGQLVLLFGAGGASRAIAYSLAARARSIKLVNRTVTKANQIAGRIRREFNIDVSSAPLSSKLLKGFVQRADIVVNASSMGMDGRNNLPIEANWLRPDQCVFDIVYKPVQTRLLELASLGRAKSITGLDMLVNQGACSFELWTGRKAPMVEMRHAVAEKLLAMEHAKGS